MKREKIIILTDYLNYFYSSATRKISTMDCQKISDLLRSAGFDVSIMNFCEIDFRKDDYSGTYILYTSQEDRDLKYKDFIEDILLGLKEKGAILIPEFKYFRSHHNKVFMEIVREISQLEEIKNIRSRFFGTFEEFEKFGKNISLPAVIKPASGAVSEGVSLINERNYKKIAKSVSFSFNLEYFIKNTVKKIINHHRLPKSLHRNKFITQNFVNGLSGDFKVLVYGEKYYVLERKNRKNDFRASGSGKLEFPLEVKKELLDFAERVYSKFYLPFISLDIAEKNGEFFLIEFQALMFGNYTLEKSEHYFAKEDGVWSKKQEGSVLEEEFCRSVVLYIGKIKK